jgi:hypothetical protein
MDCAGFEHRLSGLLAGEWRESERAQRIAELRGHARRCDACRGTIDLLDMLDQAQDERDLAVDPPSEYWEELRVSVERRCNAERSAGPGRSGGWAAVAAALLLASVGVWLLSGPASVERVEIPENLAEEEGTLPPELEALLQQAEPETVLAGMDFLSGFRDVAGVVVEPESKGAGWLGSPGANGGFLPYIEGIDAEDRGALLEWLREPVPADLGVES